jgi:MazG family protein
VGGFDELVAIAARLRGKGGCPWDRAQTLASMRPYLLEEAYEVLAAIDRADREDLEKELGDLLFTAALIARIAEEAGWFDVEGALRRVNRKMVDRHPHVFDPAHRSDGTEGDVQAWEARKARERLGRGSALDGVPNALPALLRAHRVSEKAGKVGFDWPDAAGVRAKLDEELAELDAAIASGDPMEIGEELGDVLFTLVNLGRHLPVAAEDALRMATDKFGARFRALEQDLGAEGKTVYEVDPQELEARWAAVKRKRGKSEQ